MVDYLTDWHTWLFMIALIMTVHGADKNNLRLALCGALFLIAIALDWHTLLWPHVHDCSFAVAAHEALGK